MIFITILFAITLAADPTKQRSCIVDCAKKQLGKPFLKDASGPNQFDAAGLVYYCYQECEYTFTSRPTPQQLVKMGSSVDEASLALADLVFPHEDHVQIYIGDGKIIHSPKANDVVKETTIYAFYDGRRLIEGGSTDTDTDSNVSGEVTVTTDELNVRSSPSTSGSVVASYYHGEIISYDKIVKNSECTWLSYVSNSGARRYCCGKTTGGECYVTPCP